MLTKWETYYALVVPTYSVKWTTKGARRPEQNAQGLLVEHFPANISRLARPERLSRPAARVRTRPKDPVKPFSFAPFSMEFRTVVLLLGPRLGPFSRRTFWLTRRNGRWEGFDRMEEVAPPYRYFKERMYLPDVYGDLQ